MHELTLLFANYIVKARKNRAIYFGQNLPFDDVINIYSILNPEYIVTVITTSPPASQVQDYVNRLATSFPEATILLSGYQVLSQEIKPPNNVTIFHRIEHMIAFVEASSAKALSIEADK